MSKIWDRFQTIFATVSVAVTIFLCHLATLAVNNGLKDSPNALPGGTTFFIRLCRYHVFSVFGALAICGLILSEVRITDPKKKGRVQMTIMGVTMVLGGIWFLAMSLPGICMCDAWLSWEGDGTE